MRHTGSGGSRVEIAVRRVREGGLADREPKSKKSHGLVMWCCRGWLVSRPKQSLIFLQWGVASPIDRHLISSIYVIPMVLFVGPKTPASS